MSIIGINDSHDSGAALSHNGSLEIAINEERFTKRKNDIGFPKHSISYINKNASEEIEAVALAWIGGNALLSRIFPSWDRKRLLQWKRQLKKQSRLSMHLANIGYRLSQNQNPKLLWRSFGVPISKRITRNKIRDINKDLSEKKIYIVEHHLAHAASAYYPSGFKEALIITLDGAGDGLSGTVSIGDNGKIKRLVEFKASTSLGLLYGAATLACDLRFAEDEGKLMSIAAYAYPKKIRGISDICTYDPKSKNFISKIGTRNEFLMSEYIKDHILATTDRESFAYSIQRHTEIQVITLIKQWIKETGIHNVALSGGLFSNVIVNMHIEQLPEVKDLFIFPHMGDGGLSAGAAYYIDFMLNGKFQKKQMDNAYLGPSYNESQILDVLKLSKGISYKKIKDTPKYAAETMVDNDKIILWFQGAMEYGPRALGNRSVLTTPNNMEHRDMLNRTIKRRPYYQPFASTILKEDAHKILKDYRIQNRFMTSANYVRPERYADMVAASHIDKTTRPQILGNENYKYKELIKEVRKKTGTGAVLNTSLNRHRRPIVLDPKDAIWTLKNTGAEILFIGDYVVTLTKNK